MRSAQSVPCNNSGDHNRAQPFTGTSSPLSSLPQTWPGASDFLRDAAFVKIYYNLEKDQTGSIDQLQKAKDFVEQ